MQVYSPNELGEALRMFGMTEFRDPQRQVIEATLAGKDVLVLMPTGGGKSLTYQIPAVLVRDGFVLVVSPLISLMQNQVTALRQKGIGAMAINSETPAADARTQLEMMRTGESDVRLLYVAPERAMSEAFLAALVACYTAGRLKRIAIDESHCLVQWGDDFRPEYSALGTLRSRMPSVPIMALTATATPAVRDAIVASLRFRPDYAVFQRSYNRSNLRYAVREKNDVSIVSQIFETIVSAGHLEAAGIVYCFRTRDCENTSRDLNKLHQSHTGRPPASADASYSAPYHGQMDQTVKAQVLSRWLSGAVKVVVATVAFGMGIDNDKVRFVHHHTMPKSIEAYHQETGRAGRDGLQANCVVFYSLSDFRMLYAITCNQDKTNESRVARGFQPVSQATVTRQLAELKEIREYCESRACRRKMLMKHFDEEFDQSLCKNGENPCDNCITSRTTLDGYFSRGNRERKK